jgi:hypothetical protein
VKHNDLGLRSLASPLALACALSTGCQGRPAEPERTVPAATAEAENRALEWEVPGAWTKLREGELSEEQRGPKPPRAAYRVPATGGDKSEPELTVWYFGQGSKGDPAPVVKEWRDSVEQPTDDKKESFAAGDATVEWLELAGTFKQALTPAMGPKKRAPVAMVKRDHRLIGAVVKTKHKGNWFFKLVGPDASVQAARSALRALLESAR